jgi:hypothetical protein
MTLAHRVSTVVCSPVVFTLSILGMFLALRRWREPIQFLLLALTASSLVSVAVFFNLHVIHDYYQIPLCLAPAFFAASFSSWFVEQARAGIARTELDLAVRVLAIAAISMVAIQSWYDNRIGLDEPKELVEAGAWIREDVNADDFVVYLCDHERSPSWGGIPHFLYYRWARWLHPMGRRVERASAARSQPALRRPVRADPAILSYRSTGTCRWSGSVSPFDPPCGRREGPLVHRG